MRKTISIAELRRKRGMKQISALVSPLLAKKATDVVVLDIAKLSGYADFLVICSATSTRHAQTLADEVAKARKASGGHALIEGYGAGSWILVDTGDAIIHVFTSEMRDLYDIEGLWFDAPALSVSDATAAAD